MEPDETPERPGAYTQAVINEIQSAMGEVAQPLTPFERRLIFKVIQIVERDMY